MTVGAGDFFVGAFVSRHGVFAASYLSHNQVGEWFEICVNGDTSIAAKFFGRDDFGVVVGDADILRARTEMALWAEEIEQAFPSGSNLMVGPHVA